VRVYGVSILFEIMVFLQSNADMIFGGITIVSGIVGTIAGGYVLDYINSTISNAFKVCILSYKKNVLRLEP
jgi:hypothetical protein